MQQNRQLRYTVDITRADVDAIETFLDARLDAQSAAHPPQTAEYRMASTARNLIGSVIWEAQDALDTLQDGERDPGNDLDERHRLRNAWNRLVGAAAPWRDEAGHDPDRWRHVTHTDRSYEAHAEQTVTKLRAEREVSA